MMPGFGIGFLEGFAEVNEVDDCWIVVDPDIPSFGVHFDV